MDIFDEIEDTIEIMNRLTDALDEETDMISGMRMKGLADSNQRKLKLARLNLSCLVSLRQRRAEALEATAEDPGLKARLDDAWANFTAAVNENAEALINAQQITQQVISVVVDATKNHQKDNSVYQRSGTMVRPGRPQALSVSVNTKL